MDLPPVLGYALMAAAIVDLVVARIIFSKRAEKIKADINPTATPEARKPAEDKLKAMNTASQGLTFTGIFLLLAGIFIVA